jgi:hypothetical protein
MPQPIAYNTGSQTSGSLKLNGIEYAISSSIVSGSNGQRWFSSVNPGNGIVLVTNSFTQSYSTYQNSTPLFYTASALTEAAITGAINGLPDRFGQVPFTTTASAFAWVANSRKYFMMNYEYPQIVTDGLVVLNDAKFLASYPTTQSIWYDISGFNNSGSLINGPLFNSNGWINFDGSDDYANYPFNGRSSTVNTVEMLVRWRSNPSGTGMFIGFTTYDIWTNGNALGFNTGAGDVYGIPSARVSALNLIGSSSANWRYYTFVFTNQVVNNKIYINSIQEILSQQSGTTNLTASRSFSSTFRLSGWNNDTNYPIPGDFASVKIYNRELSQSEILQNYYQAPIVTDGLVFAVDAGNLVSYESGSTTTYSLTGSLSGSLVNGVGYNSGDGGNWTFDGVNDYINTSLQTLDRPCTFSIWINLNSLLGFQTFFGQDTSQSIPRGRFYFQKANATTEGIVTNKVNFSIVLSDGGIVPVNANDVISINKWYNYTAVLTTTSISLYENGILQNTVNDSNIFLPANTPITLNAGYYGNAIVDFVNGKSSTFQIYNRALSAQEVAQNFQAQRSRFGL